VKRVLLLLSLLPISIQGQGPFIYDQQSTNETAGGEGAAAIQLNQPFGQSFTPSLSAVGFVRLWLFDGSQNNGQGATVYINLRADSITGPILSSTDPVPMPDNFGRGTNGYVNFVFPSPVAVTPGTNYYFQPVVQSGDVWQVVHDMHYNYAGGTAFFLGQAAPSFDLWFREGVVTPEPSATILLLLGGAILFYLQRSRLQSHRSNSKSP
jgi:hypothetical protein